MIKRFMKAMLVFVNPAMSGSKDSDYEVLDDIQTVSFESELQPPARYKVLLMNDDFTTMDFVVDLLQRYFSLSEEAAIQIMLIVHKQGKAVCGVYSKDIAETKAEQVNQYARQADYPLLCVVEKME